MELLGAFVESDVNSTADFVVKLIYSYLLHRNVCTHAHANRLKVNACYSTLTGGFSKHPEFPPDLLHSFYSLCWLSMAGSHGLQTLDVKYGMTQRSLLL